MPDKLSVERGRTAVLIMDYQTDIVGYVGVQSEALLKSAARVLQESRDAKIPVIYVVVGFRADYPEISPRNSRFGAIRQTGRFSAGAPGSEVHAAVAPQGGDITVVKHRVSAFAGTDLDMILRAKEIETLVLLGIATSGVVLSTLRRAADADYRCIVLKDCCADRDAEVHRCLVEKVFPMQAAVVTSEEFLAAIRSHA
ncbi:MAG: cysteine hydrolase family protein [Candidatus Brocadiia bacterium]